MNCFPVCVCLPVCIELANKLQEKQEEIKDLDVRPYISADPDESQGDLSPPDETLDGDSLNHTSTDYITWNGTHSLVGKHYPNTRLKWNLFGNLCRGRAR